MINAIEGIVASIKPMNICVKAGHVYYNISSPLNVSERFEEQDNIVLLIHEDIGETKYDLYGFQDERDRDLFCLLISVPGIGCRTALVVISVSDRESILAAIGAQDAAFFESIKGIGKKTAMQIITSLEGKGVKGSVSLDKRNDVILALVSLGYKRTDVSKVIGDIHPDFNEGNTSQIIRDILKHITK